jgi:hypothetical protein
MENALGNGSALENAGSMLRRNLPAVNIPPADAGDVSSPLRSFPTCEFLPDITAIRF